MCLYTIWTTPTPLPQLCKYLVDGLFLNQKMSVMLRTGATFVKKNSCLIARIISFDTVGLHLLTLRILEQYPSKDIALDLIHVISH